MTQLQGEAGQDALNFPGRIDNQLVVLYGNDRRRASASSSTAVTERYADLKPQFEHADEARRPARSRPTEVATFNAAATRAGAAAITIK